MHLDRLRSQGIARRPQTLIRTRYGQLKGIDSGAAGATQPRPQPLRLRSAEEKSGDGGDEAHCRRDQSNLERTDSAIQDPCHEDLEEAPSAPPSLPQQQKTACWEQEKLEIDLDNDDDDEADGDGGEDNC